MLWKILAMYLTREWKIAHVIQIKWEVMIWAGQLFGICVHLGLKFITF